MRALFDLIINVTGTQDQDQGLQFCPYGQPIL